MVVMYDAMGVRRQAGYHAHAINNLINTFSSGNLAGAANLSDDRDQEAGRTTYSQIATDREEEVPLTSGRVSEPLPTSSDKNVFFLPIAIPCER